MIGKTWRINEVVPEQFREDLAPILSGKEPASILFPHGKMFPIWVKMSTIGAVPVVSMSRDGGRLVTFLRTRLGYDEVLRGSSSTKGKELMAEMEQTLESRSILLTPDGPRGPSGKVKAGGVVAAQRTNRRVLLVTWRADRSLTLSSWDRMEIPFPFTTIYIRYCTLNPINIQNNINNAESWFSAEGTENTIQERGSR